MMTFSGMCVRENQRLNFNKNTRLIKDLQLVCLIATHLQEKEYSNHETKNDANMQNIANNNVWLLPQCL